MNYRIFILVGCLITCLDVFSQEDFRLFFIEPQVKSGLIVPNADFYPDPGLQKGLAVNIGGVKSDSDLGRKLRYAPTGVQLGYTHYGNDAVFGQSFQLVPFMSVRCAPKTDRVWDFRFGLGASYFTTFYDREENPRNRSIGSAFNWNFQAFLYYTFLQGERESLRLGGGYSHHSNGHVQLPNFGLNSALLSVSYSFQSIPHQQVQKMIDRSTETDLTQFVSIQLRQGLGQHEFGGTIGPVGGEKKFVYTTALAASMNYRRFVKISSGLAYRRYEHFRNYIDSVRPPAFIDNPRRNSTNLYFFMGVELFLGHVGVEMNGGINLFKPFHETYNDLFENSTGLGYLLKRYVPTRLAINAYLLKPSRYPRYNVFVSSSMNANFGEADFGELSVGAVLGLRERAGKNMP